MSDGSSVQTTGPLVYYENQINELRNKNTRSPSARRRATRCSPTR